jgi:hypothetical protein
LQTVHNTASRSIAIAKSGRRGTVNGAEVSGTEGDEEDALVGLACWSTEELGEKETVGLERCERLGAVEA